MAKANRKERQNPAKKHLHIINTKDLLLLVIRRPRRGRILPPRRSAHLCLLRRRRRRLRRLSTQIAQTRQPDLQRRGRRRLSSPVRAVRCRSWMCVSGCRRSGGRERFGRHARARSLLRTRACPPRLGRPVGIIFLKWRNDLNRYVNKRWVK